MWRLRWLGSACLCYRDSAESWCVGLFDLKLALFIASIESEMSAIRKQRLGTTLPVKQFITGIWLITTSRMFFYWMIVGVVTVTLNFRSCRQSNSCLLAVLERRYRIVVWAVPSRTAISTSPGCDTLLPMVYGSSYVLWHWHLSRHLLKLLLKYSMM